MDYRAISYVGLLLTVVACSSAATSPGPGTQTPGMVGAAGGTVVSADGVARLDVPAGALAGPVALSLTPATGMPLDPAVVGPSAYTIAPAGTTFAVPAILKIAYQPSLRPAGTTENELRIHRLVSGAWLPHPQSPQIDAAADSASAAVTTTGSFAVRWPTPTSDCSMPEDRLFDFWLGEWTFTQTHPPGPPGVNSIARDSTGCLILENFNNGLGRSISFFSRNDRRWHQTYVDSSGRRVAMSGAFEDGAMRLFDTSGNRWTWQRTDSTTVRYFGEAMVNGAWVVGFDSRYSVRSSAGPLIERERP